jgi:hypothetical protein
VLFIGLEEHAIAGANNLDRSALTLAPANTLGDIYRLAVGKGVPAVEPPIEAVRDISIVKTRCRKVSIASETDCDTEKGWNTADSSGASTLFQKLSFLRWCCDASAPSWSLDNVMRCGRFVPTDLRPLYRRVL